MKFDLKDLKHLQWAIAFILVMILVGGGSVWTSQGMKKSSERAFKAALAQRVDIQAKLARARDEQAELRDKIGRFQGIMAKGYIGPEKRLDWIEAIARIKAAHRIFKLEYEFGPQRPVDAGILPGGATVGGFEIMASQMRLQAELLHEGELLALLEELRNAVQAVIQIRSCGMERMTATSVERGNNANIRAECTLEWITFREAK